MAPLLIAMIHSDSIMIHVPDKSEECSDIWNHRIPQYDCCWQILALGLHFCARELPVELCTSVKLSINMKKSDFVLKTAIFWARMPIPTNVNE